MFLKKGSRHFTTNQPRFGNKELRHHCCDVMFSPSSQRVMWCFYFAANTDNSKNHNWVLTSYQAFNLDFKTKTSQKSDTLKRLQLSASLSSRQDTPPKKNWQLFIKTNLLVYRRDHIWNISKYEIESLMMLRGRRTKTRNSITARHSFFLKNITSSLETCCCLGIDCGSVTAGQAISSSLFLCLTVQSG